MAFLVVIIVLIVGLGMYLVGIYNGLVKSRNRYKNAYAQIDVQLKRRYDLIPNLVETAKGTLAHERETLEAVIQARNQAVTAMKAAAANPGDPSAMAPLKTKRPKGPTRLIMPAAARGPTAAPMP